MKTIIGIFVCVILSISMLSAQESDVVKEETNETEYTAEEVYPLGVGLFIAATGGVNTLDSPDGVKNGFVFSTMPDFGAQVYIPFGSVSNLGAVIDFAYISYAYQFKLYSDNSIKWDDRVSYFTIAPNFHFSGLLFGFNFGIPLAAETGNDVEGNPYNYEYKKDNMNFLVDIHLGALIPVYKDNFGRVNLYVQGEYGLSQVFTNDIVAPMTGGGTQTFNIQPAAVKLGLSYIFNTGLMQK